MRLDRRTLDAAVLAWVIAWLALGYWTAREVRELSTVTSSVRSVGGAVVSAGDAIGGLERLPLVGAVGAKPGASVPAARRGARQAAPDARAAGRRLSVLLGVAVAFIPTLPLLAVYLPPRLALHRDRRAARGLGDELLARRALVHLPLHE